MYEYRQSVQSISNPAFVLMTLPYRIPALHAERISNVLNSRSDPAWFEVELEDRILEDDLALQLSFLRDHDSNSYIFADVIDENAANFASPIAAEPPQANHATDVSLLAVNPLIPALLYVNYSLPQCDFYLIFALLSNIDRYTARSRTF